MKTLAGGGELRCIPDIKMSKTLIYCIQPKNSQCKKMLKKKSQKTVEIESRNVVETDTTSLCLLKKPTYRQHFRGRRRFNCAIMRKKLTPIFRQISDVATPKSVKKMAEMTVCAASQRLSKAYSGGFVGEVSAAETSYFVSSCCLQRSSDTSLHLPSQFKQCK